MVVLVNAISIKEGGALVVVKRLLQNFLLHRPDIDWHVMVDPDLVNESFFNQEGIKAWSLDRKGCNSLMICMWYEAGLPRLVRKIGADVVFSLTNYLPVFSRLPSLLLVQHAGHFSACFEACQKQEFPGLANRLAWQLKKQWVRRSIDNATMVTVQTEALANAITQERSFLPDTVKVVPHGLGLLEIGRVKTLSKDRPWRVGYITKYGVQKNFLVLFKAIAQLQNAGHDVCLVLTLYPQTQHCPKLMAQVKAVGIEPCIENHGEVEQEQIVDLYDSLDLFVFPSLCESFGFPMLEAMSRGLPLLVSDTPGNLEIVGDTTLSFGANDVDGLAKKIVRVMSDSKVYAEASKGSLKRAQTFSWQKAAHATLALLDEIVAENCGEKYDH